MYCRCWKSDTFPLCDGAHVAHNKDTGDNVGPLIVAVVAAASASKSTTAAEALDSKGAEEIEPTTISSSSTTIGKMNKLKSIIFRRNNSNYTNNSGGSTAGGLTTRERLAKMGLSALLSYGWVSNMSYAVTLSLSWFGFCKKVRVVRQKEV